MFYVLKCYFTYGLGLVSCLWRICWQPVGSLSSVCWRLVGDLSAAWRRLVDGLSLAYRRLVVRLSAACWRLVVGLLVACRPLANGLLPTAWQPAGSLLTVYWRPAASQLRRLLLWFNYGTNKRVARLLWSRGIIHSTSSLYTARPSDPEPSTSSADAEPLDGCPNCRNLNGRIVCLQNMHSASVRELNEAKDTIREQQRTINKLVNANWNLTNMLAGTPTVPNIRPPFPPPDGIHDAPTRAPSPDCTPQTALTGSSSGGLQGKEQGAAAATTSARGAGRTSSTRVTGRGGKGGYQCVLCGPLYTSRDMLRHFKTKHTYYAGGILRDHLDYPKFFHYKTVAPRLRCPMENLPPPEIVRGVKGIKLQ